MKTRAVAAALLTLLLAFPAAVAHEKNPATPADTTGAPLESLATALDSIALNSARAIAPVKPPPAPYVIPPLTTALLDHPHNKIVHFTIVLALVGALLLWLPRRSPELVAAARLLVWAAAAAAIAAYFTGQAQHEPFEGEPKEWLMRVHRNWGIATGIAMLAWAGLVAWRPASRAGAWWGLLVSILVGVVSFLGGLVAHGH
jgi:hypothetical protein